MNGNILQVDCNGLLLEFFMKYNDELRILVRCESNE